MGDFDELAVDEDFALIAVVLAGILGVCTTVLKKICREHGIKRWPQRKLQSINKMMASIECAMRNSSQSGDRIEPVLFTTILISIDRIRCDWKSSAPAVLCTRRL